jgi:hypothetical protein
MVQTRSQSAMVQTRSQSAMVQNRSQTRSKKTINILTTPGIITQIVSHLDDIDPAITSLFLLVNDAHLRHELQPSVDIVAQYKEAKYIEDKKIEQERKTIVIRDHIRQSLDDVMFISGRREQFRKAELIMKIFDYMCSLHDDLFLVGNFSFAYDMRGSINKCILQSIQLGMKEFETKMKEYKIKLTPFIDFYLEHGHVEYIDIY